jgi:hypothetical protein
MDFAPWWQANALNGDSIISTYNSKKKRGPNGLKA